MKYLSVLVFTLLTVSVFGQTVEETIEVKTLMDNFEKIGKEQLYVEGWRIKLISTTDRRALEKAKWLFEKKYPDLIYSLSHEAPYYSMKVGAFEKRIDVEPLLMQFKEDFPLAIPFRDKVTKTELLSEYENR